MSTSRHIDKICCIIMVLVVIMTAFYANAEKFGISVMAVSMGYEQRLFATDRVHTIDIVMDDWEGFLDTCENEEYELCAVVIDQESYKNVGIRAKGNTSLSAVSSYGNDRYSFKIEFDHYDSTKTYYGLDKISLNNIIQDNTYMKDYLSYQMMGAFGVSAPLCSYAYITVNGEDWGLYLAVEGVEDSFLERNYGSDYGELYKPDSMDMGGGRGNGGRFDMDQFDKGERPSDSEFSSETPQAEGRFPTGMEPPAEDQSSTGEEPPTDNPFPPGIELPTEDQSSTGEEPPSDMQPPSVQEEGLSDEAGTDDETETDSEADRAFGQKRQGGFPGFEGRFGGKGSDDVSLIYSDDDADSYKNIFDNAKTDPANADQARLIRSIKNMNEKEDIENCVDTEAVMRYFVVHNFVCNFDSYTGSMIHNYYLYEENGQMSMIPWDYNLAFGGFMSQPDADSLINYPIDTPVSGGSVESRPMLAWILEDEQYTSAYHQLFGQFISDYFDSGYFASMMDSVTEMISPYVEKDPTKFCTFEEFEKGAATLKEFCLLRAKSINGQLDGTIPSTSEGQKTDDSACIDGSGITISDMGTMGDIMRHNMTGQKQNPDGTSNSQDDQKQNNGL